MGISRRRGLPSKSYRCSECNGEPVQVPSSFRAPKRKDKKQWQLLEKIIGTDFILDQCEAPIGSLAYHWMTHGGFGCTIHLPDSMRFAMQIPQRLSQYDDWVIHMRTTQFA